ncbi:unnamed protein product [Mucor hiemalis]
MSDWQFDAPEEKHIYLELVNAIRDSLKQEGYYQPPVVAFDENVETERVQEWSHYVQMLGGQVIGDFSGATHIIYDNQEPAFNPERRTYYIEEKKDGKSLIHFVGLPESYNVLVDELPQREEVPRPNLSSPWHVRATWIIDSYKYNEWMTPVDYDYPEKQVNRFNANLKRSVEEVSSSNMDMNSPSKKAKTPLLSTDVTLEIGDETLVTAKVEGEESILGTEGEGADAVIAGTVEDPATLLPIDLSAIPLPEDDPQRYLSIQTLDIVIPSYAAWFDITCVNIIESRALPEFFNNRNKSKTPTIYKEYRDFMINTYRMNPVEYLTITACRRNLTGDVCAILRVHSFLEQWGLINYQVDPEAKLSSLSPPFDSQFKVIIDKPSEEITISSIEEDIVKMEIPASPYDFSKKKEPQTCSSCENVCKDLQYCSTSQKNFYLCRSCYVAGNYPVSQKSGEFVVERLEKEKNLEADSKEEKKEEENDEVEDKAEEKNVNNDDGENEDDSWDEKEEELLKEGLGMFDDNWEKIADHVGTRTHDECILHYLQLPTNDPFEDAEISKLGLLQYDLAEHKENPIMTAVAFLASAVKPQVAASAGHIDAIEIIPVERKVTEEEEEAVKEEEKKDAKEEEEEESKMEVDTNEEQTKPARTDREESDLLDLTNELIHFKLKQYEEQYSNYEILEGVIDEQKRELEKERRQLERDQGLLKKKILLIRQEMFKKINTAQASAVVASNMTPAQLQQKLAGASPSMFLNGIQHQQQSPQQLQQLQMQMQLKQQQQYQLQMQMQMQQQQQQQQQQHQQQQQQHHRSGFNNINI